MPQRVRADQCRPGDLANDRRDDFLFGDGGEAVTDASIVGFDLDDAARQVGGLARTPHRDLDRDRERCCANRGDFHRSLAAATSRAD